MKFVSIRNRLIAIVAFLLFYSQIVYADICDDAVAGELQDIVKELPKVAAALGALMLAILGVKWIMSDNPQEREDAKKGIIYVIIGLLLVTTASDLVKWLYCRTLP